MKKTITYLGSALMMLIASGVQAQDQLENGSFENWEDLDISETPDDWLTILGTFYPEDPNVYKITDGFSGNAVHLETVLSAEGEAAMGGIVLATSLGEEDGDLPEGYPYASHVDEISAYLRYDIAPLDTGSVIVILENGGVPFAFLSEQIYGTQATWDEFTWSLDDPILTPDAVTIIFFSSDGGESEPVVGSWLEIDDVSFGDDGGTPDPLPNFSFENWSDLSIEISTDWYSFDPTLTAVFGFQNISKSTDAFAGDFSSKITVYETNITEDIFPFISNGQFDFDTEEFYGGTPFTGNPILYKGHYKFISDETEDTAKVYLRFWNEDGDEAIYVDTLLFPTTDWTEFSIPVDLDFTPDSVLTVLLSGKALDSETYFDDLRFVYDDVSVSETASISINAYPNPTTDLLNITLDQTADLIITDMLGKAIFSEIQVNKTTQVNTSNWPSGLYLIQVYQGNDFNTLKVAVQH